MKRSLEKINQASNPYRIHSFPLRGYFDFRLNQALYLTTTKRKGAIMVHKSKRQQSVIFQWEKSCNQDDQPDCNINECCVASCEHLRKNWKKLSSSKSYQILPKRWTSERRSLEDQVNIQPVQEQNTFPTLIKQLAYAFIVKKESISRSSRTYEQQLSWTVIFIIVDFFIAIIVIVVISAKGRVKEKQDDWQCSEG